MAKEELIPSDQITINFPVSNGSTQAKYYDVSGKSYIVIVSGNSKTQESSFSVLKEELSRINDDISSTSNAALYIKSSRGKLKQQKLPKKWLLKKALT